MKHGTIQGSYRKYCDRGSWQGMETDGKACPVPEKDKPGTFGEGEGAVTFTNGEIFHERGLTESELSRDMVKDLKKRGVKYLGPVTMYSYLQTVGVINSHEESCFLY